MPPRRRGGRVDGRAHGRVVADVGAEPVAARRGRVEVEDRDLRAPRGQQPGRGQPDAGRAAGDQRAQAVQFKFSPSAVRVLGRSVQSSAVDSPPMTRARNSANRITPPSMASIQ